MQEAIKKLQFLDNRNLKGFYTESYHEMGNNYRMLDSPQSLVNKHEQINEESEECS